jgi:phenylacetate-coenzyme A ligase PaaK-like adenylate-forming protein
VFPSQVETILSRFPALNGTCQVLVDKRTPQHVASLKVETRGTFMQAEQRSTAAEIIAEVKNRIGITFNEVVFVPSGTFEAKYKKSVVIK